ncbi:PQQ-binding-like beta-propeller repeat protein [Roseiconus lacunae]|uniref:PQQ-binding-like beta-propeller repeat protein n=1 Tax=Roseiconus lacunae TaxID=2605694 RepID=A0ABT7PGT9_9BACT|nr:PQQ-binding-like beta-propeller repeat protein [Roseiconus lacunae]MDM4015461.1 PQQ-binding-like beta-propeller repeat protein [Roseiconus lacunae]
MNASGFCHGNRHSHVQSMIRYRAFYVLVLTVAFVGCRKRTPVNEISTSESGIQVQEFDRSLTKGDWNQWRGPQGDGVAVDQPLPIEWGESKNIDWDVDIPGRGHGSPIVVNDLVVVSTAIDSTEEQRVVAFDQHSGEQKWSTVVHQGGFPSRRDVHQKATNANGTVASDGNLFVIAHLNQNQIIVSALDQSGEIAWQRDIGAFASKFGYAPSPILYKSLVIVAADNFGGGYIAGLDLASGEVAWRRSRGDASTYSSPHVATVGGIDQLLIAGGNRVASYDPATGEPLWETEGTAASTCGTVVTAGEKVFASGGYPDKETVCLSASGERLWSQSTKLYEPSPITDGKNLFGVTDDGIAICWSGDEGTVLWRKRLGGNFSGSPVLCNGHLYVADLSGNTYVFAASAEGYQPIAKNRLGDDCYASPAISDSAIYLRIGIGSGNNRKERLVKIRDTSGKSS